MSELIGLLERFNRKERYFLIGQALGNAGFCLSEDFRGRLGGKIGVSVPPKAFTAMDYHLDCVAASLVCHVKGDDPDDYPIFPNEDGRVVGNQQDTDLLIAFVDEEKYHLVFLEAKGYESWNHVQLLRKASRLERIFGNDGKKYPEVTPHFCMMSPREPSIPRMVTDRWPDWMTDKGTPLWVKLCLPDDRIRVTRCNRYGASSSQGTYFRIVRA